MMKLRYLNIAKRDSGSLVIPALTFLLVLFFAAFPSQQAFATHSSGADLTYTWVSGNTYTVTVSFYRDCAGVAAPGTVTLNAKSTSCSRNQNFTLNLVPGTGQEITFPCRTVQTKCTNAASPYAGYQKYEYKNNVTLPQQCADWVFSFYVCCRNCAITTLNAPCSDNMYVEATFNNLAFQSNSSPQFTNIPVAFVCVNQSFTYNHGVFDPNGDSLVYSFVTPKKFDAATSTIGTVTFNPGYSAASPLSSSPAVSLNSNNGDINMNATVNGEIGVTAILVREYRNGVLIGSVIRDMQFLTKVCNPNLLPVASGINGTNIFATVGCPGSTISFTVNSTDPNPTDTVLMYWNDVIPGATFTTSGILNPVGTFTWTPTLADARSQPYSFIVIVRDNACPTNGSQTFSYSITVPVIDVSVTSPGYNGYNLHCNGGSDGAITAVAVGGTLPYTYAWNPSGQTTQTATGLGVGTFTVTVTDASGCTKTNSTTLTAPPTIIATSVASSTDVSCNGGTDGTATASASGGILPYTYSWAPGGQTTITATGLAANSYIVTVTDRNGCTSEDTVLITEPTILNAAISGFNNVTCNGNANGTISTTVSGGTSPYTHSWSNGDTTANISGLAPGTYADTVRDSKGCQQIITQTITQPGAAVGIPASSLVSTDVLCNGGFTGTANVVPSGGTPPYNVSWSNGDIGNSADSLFAGTYTVTIVDANLCTFDTTVLITEPLVLSSTFINFSITPGGTNIGCNGDSTGTVKASVIGGTAPYTYAWSNGSVLDSIAQVPAGSYSVTVTDNHGCTTLISTTLTEPATLQDSLIVHHVICRGESSGWIKTVAYGGSIPYSYMWSPLSQTTDSIGGLPAGFYDVTITDINGCALLDTITVTEPDTLVSLITSIQFFGDVNVRCFGDSSGTVSAQVTGGTPPYNFLWSTGSGNDTIFNLPAGAVEVSVSDINGCSILGSTTLVQPNPFAYAPVIQQPKCFGDSSGYVILNTSGSVAPYTYLWSNGATTDSCGHLTSGTVYAIVTDVNNCTDSVGFVLPNPDSLTTPAVTADFQGYGVQCNGGSNGFISLTVTGGDGNYTYLWSNSQTTDSIGGLTSGTYDVTIIDGNGCRKDTSVTISEPLPLSDTLLSSVYSGGVNVSCFGYNDGTAYATASGGVPPYQYLWSNGDVADSAVGLSAGTYYLTVTDSNGCQHTDSISFTQPIPVNLSATFSLFNGYNVPCNGDSLACITVAVGGGSTPYTYEWDIDDNILGNQACNLPADTINVRVFDANGCMLDTSFILTEPLPLDPVATISGFNGFNLTCNNSGDGFINLNVNGGVAPISYLWSTTETTQNITGLAANSYTVNITDANGCVDSASFTLTEPPAITNTISSTATTCGQSNGSATVVVTSGLTPYTYSWNPGGQSTATASGLSPGTYYITITDSVNCTHLDSVVVSALPTITASISSQIDNLCFGSALGSASVAFSGGTSPFTYSWTNGDTGITADSLPAGAVTVTITDANNCTGTVSATITESPQLIPTVSGVDARCSGVNDGTANVSVTGGASPYNYSWSNGDIGTGADSLGAGYIVVTITDNNNCVVLDSVNILQPGSVASSIAATSPVSCNTGDNGNASVTAATGGTAPYTYAWSNSDTGLIADSLTAGTISVVITDANGCTLNLNATITQPQAIAITATSVNVTCYGTSDGSANANVNGGIIPYTYSWSPSGGTTSSASGLAPNTYTVTVTDGNNCTSTSSVIIVQPNQIAANAGTDQTGCDPIFALDAQLNGAVTGTWSYLSGSATFSSISSPNSTVTNLTDGTNILLWTITDGTCYGYDTVQIIVPPVAECDLDLPTAFSPNGDPFGEFYEIHGINRYPENIFTVFNRWGNEVYKKENYMNTDWNGQNKDGEALPEGTYFVVLTIKNSDIRKNTYVDLRR
ncbi:MAG: gliding motility-associated C-terminal domain-containing protein [Bacteroidetes bacterium]|nr:gliding motility-associated C-terminal domain-containing protein [Bacteroidota bacterium]